MVVSTSVDEESPWKFVKERSKDLRLVFIYTSASMINDRLPLIPSTYSRIARYAWISVMCSISYARNVGYSLWLNPGTGNYFRTASRLETSLSWMASFRIDGCKKLKLLWWLLLHAQDERNALGTQLCLEWLGVTLSFGIIMRDEYELFPFWRGLNA